LIICAPPLRPVADNGSSIYFRPPCFHHYGVGFFRVCCDLIAVPFELAYHRLAIDEVLGTTETYETYFCHQLDLDA